MILTRFETSFEQYLVRIEQDFSQAYEKFPPQILTRNITEQL